MSEATLRAAVYAAVNGVTSVGKVYDYQRYSTELTAYLSLFQTVIGGKNQVRAWTVTHESAPGDQLAIKKLVRRTYSYRVRGYMSLDDSAASEKTFAALVESVMNGLDDSTALHAAAAHVGYAELGTFGYISFGTVLCHYCEIVQQVAETRTAAV